MAALDSMLLRMEDYTKNAEAVKGLVLSQLITDKVISQEQYDKYQKEYGMILIKKSWYKAIFSDKEWEYRFVILK